MLSILSTNGSGRIVKQVVASFEGSNAGVRNLLPALKQVREESITYFSSYVDSFLIFFYAYVSQFYDVFFFYRKALATI